MEVFRVPSWNDDACHRSPAPEEEPDTPPPALDLPFCDAFPGQRAHGLTAAPDLDARRCEHDREDLASPSPAFCDEGDAIEGHRRNAAPGRGAPVLGHGVSSRNVPARAGGGTR